MLFEIETQVQDRFPQHAGGAEQERDQQATKTSVAVKERMDRLELDVNEGRLN
jgi:hypothetical protein